MTRHRIYLFTQDASETGDMASRLVLQSYLQLHVVLAVPSDRFHKRVIVGFAPCSLRLFDSGNMFHLALVPHFILEVSRQFRHFVVHF